MKWIRGILAAIGLIVAAYISVVLFVARSQVVNPKADSPTLEAKVVRFGSIPSKWQADKVVMVASTPDGRTGHGVLARKRVHELDCKVGAPVGAHMDGAVLVVDALTCGKGWRAKA